MLAEASSPTFSEDLLLTREIACSANSFELDGLDDRCNHGTDRHCKRWEPNDKSMKDRLTIYQDPSYN